MRNADYQKVVGLRKKYKSIETMLRHASAEQRVILEKQERRWKNRITKDFPKSFCDNLIKNKMQEIANAMPDEGYSMGSVVKVSFATLTVRDDRTETYAKSCSYRPTHGAVTYKLTADEIRNISIIGGIVTYIYPKQRNKVKKCYWYAGVGSKNRFSYEKVEGFVFADFHSKNKELAKIGGLANIARKKNRIKLAKEQAKEQALYQKKYRKALRSEYSYQDSLNAGNCEVGTKAFILRLKLDEEKNYRGSFLLKKAKEKSTSAVYFIEKMINNNIC